MSIRTTAVAVKALLAPGRDYNTKDNPSLDPFIEAASAIVDDLVQYAADRSITLGASRPELIERWLAAHGYCMSDQTYASKSTGGASGSFHGQTGMMLKATKYGQMALTLDPTGYLATIDSQQVAGFSWGGKAEPDQLSYDERN